MLEKFLTSVVSTTDVKAAMLYPLFLVVPPPRKGEGSSVLTRIQDDMFVRVVDETLTQARANPDQFSLTP